MNALEKCTIMDAVNEIGNTFWDERKTIPPARLAGAMSAIKMVIDYLHDLPEDDRERDRDPLQEALNAKERRETGL